MSDEATEKTVDRLAELMRIMGWDGTRAEYRWLANALEQEFRGEPDLSIVWEFFPDITCPCCRCRFRGSAFAPVARLGLIVGSQQRCGCCEEILQCVEVRENGRDWCWRRLR